MMARHARSGRVERIFIRPARRQDVQTVTGCNLASDGLSGDHASAGKRALTLIQDEHLSVISALMGKDDVDPGLLRRNVVVSGINLLALRKRRVRLGQAVIHITGPCPPCSRMEKVLGAGGYSAMRGHGGVYAEVLESGRLSVGDDVRLSDKEPAPPGIL